MRLRESSLHLRYEEIPGQSYCTGASLWIKQAPLRQLSVSTLAITAPPSTCSTYALAAFLTEELYLKKYRPVIIAWLLAAIDAVKNYETIILGVESRP